MRYALSLALLLMASSARAEYQACINLPPPTDYDPGRIFADAMQTARPPGLAATPAQEDSPVDANGWPTGDAAWVVMTGLTPADAGAYSLRFVGTGATITTPGSPGWSVSGQTTNAGVTTATLTFTGTGDPLYLSITGVTGGAKNVSLMRPGNTFGGNRYSNRFLATLRPFKCIRTMDLLETNFNPVATWANRTPDTYATMGRKIGGLNGSLAGSSIESVCKLAQESGRAVWFNVPHLSERADWDASFSALIHSSCTGNTPVYIEFSNEVWNSQFGQFADSLLRGYCETTAPNWVASHAYTAWDPFNPTTFTNRVVKNGGSCYTVKTGGTSSAANPPTGTGSSITDGSVTWSYEEAITDSGTLNWDSETNPFYLGYRHTAKRIAEISNAFRTEFGNAAMGTKIRILLEGQNFTTTNAQGLAMLGSPLFSAHPASYYLYGLGTSPYFHEDLQATASDNTYTCARLKNEYRASIWAHHDGMVASVAQAHNNGLKAVQYELGIHTIFSASLAAKTACQTDPEMQAILSNSIQDMIMIGVDEAAYYSHSSAYGASGFWGLYTDLDTPTPKSLAYELVGTNNPRRPKLNPPLSINVLAPSATGGSSSNVSGCKQFSGSGSWLEYQVTLPGAGDGYKLALSYKNTNATSNWNVTVNGTSVHNRVLTNTSGNATALVLGSDAYLAGINTLRVTETTANGTSLCAVAVTDQ